MGRKWDGILLSLSLSLFSLFSFSKKKEAIGQFGLLWHNLPREGSVQLYPKVERVNVKGLSRCPLCHSGTPAAELQSPLTSGRVVGMEKGKRKASGVVCSDSDCPL
ncbi:hypothetical protein QBC45DRAFT_398532 [Copromyces sp. CBS 386.78]|nr:hypothetical protein QBC45DRAFT_398532 [Copromyces sp. CBS 386.78]